MRLISHSEEQTEKMGNRLGGCLTPGAVLAFYGGLGAGKTAFIRGLARGMGLDAAVTSPTFTVVNEYEGKIPLFHFDMYRLGSADELFDIGWDDYTARGGVCAVEWSENVEDALDGDAIRVQMSRCPENEDWREITIEGICFDNEDFSD